VGLLASAPSKLVIPVPMVICKSNEVFSKLHRMIKVGKDL